MFAYKKNSFRPTLEALEDRCLASASPWAALNQAHQQVSVLQNQITMLGDAAMVLQQTQTTAAEMSQRFADLQAAKWIRIEVPQGWFQGNGLRVNISNTNLGSVLNSIPTNNFYVSRDVNHRTAEGFWVKFEYQYTAKGYASPWTLINGWSTSGAGNNEKINVPSGWNPREINANVNQEFKFNLRVTLMGPNNLPVPGEQYQTGAFNVQLFGGTSQTGAAAQGNGVQTQAASDRFLASLAQTAGQISNANANTFAQAERTLLDGHESVDAFLMQARMHDWAHMSEAGSAASSAFQHSTNAMAQGTGF